MKINLAKDLVYVKVYEKDTCVWENKKGICSKKGGGVLKGSEHSHKISHFL